MKETIRAILQPVADIFSGFNTPELITHWGHPFFMSIVIFGMGSFVAITGWRSRISEDKEIKQSNKLDHHKLAPFLFLFITLGYSGGVLSLIMQDQPIFESNHFWTGSTVIGLLGLNGLISATGFGGNKDSLRTIHAYLGSLALTILIIHAILGVKLGLSI
jgi:fucose 4-O-acetylase-like acetyltransferase